MFFDGVFTSAELCTNCLLYKAFDITIDDSSSPYTFIARFNNHTLPSGTIILYYTLSYLVKSGWTSLWWRFKLSQSVLKGNVIIEDVTPSQNKLKGNILRFFLTWIQTCSYLSPFFFSNFIKWAQWWITHEQRMVSVESFSSKASLMWQFGNYFLKLLGVKFSFKKENYSNISSTTLYFGPFNILRN